MQNSFTYEPFREFSEFDQYILAKELYEFCVHAGKCYGSVYVFRDPDETFLITVSAGKYMFVVLTEGENKGEKVFAASLESDLGINIFTPGPWINRCELLMGCVGR